MDNCSDLTACHQGGRLVRELKITQRKYSYKMATDSTRAWTSPIISKQSTPPLPHEPQNYTTTASHISYPAKQMSADPRPQYTTEPLYGPAGGPMSQAIPLQGPVSHPDGPREYTYQSAHLSQYSIHPPESSSPSATAIVSDGRQSPKQDVFYGTAGEPFNRPRDVSSPPSPGHDSSSSQGGAGANHYPSSNNVPRLPPIMQVEKQQVTTSATQLASASRRRNEAHFVCPVPGCGSTFTRRFNLRGKQYHR